MNLKEIFWIQTSLDHYIVMSKTNSLDFIVPRKKIHLLILKSWKSAGNFLCYWDLTKSRMTILDIFKGQINIYPWWQIVISQKPYCKQTSYRKNCKLFSQDAIEKTQKNARNYYETKRSRNAFIKDHVTFEDVMRRRKKTKEQKKTERMLTGTICP